MILQARWSRHPTACSRPGTRCGMSPSTKPECSDEFARPGRSGTCAADHAVVRAGLGFAARRGLSDLMRRRDDERLSTIGTDDGLQSLEFAAHGANVPAGSAGLCARHAL